MNHLEQFRDIKTFIFDVDGVLTDGQVLVLEDGALLRRMSIRDGYAIKQAVKEGYNVCIITGSASEGVKKRLENLGVEHIYISVEDKLRVFEKYIRENQIDEESILYMGDDVPDYAVMRRVGFPTCPKDAAHEMFQLAMYVSPYEGGMGCVRDVIEKVLRLNGHWRVG
ncbi:MAG: 3-deoxy-D-manno-octulosonate 8-phosphate phosphatase [Phaeodactylibacter sp.]|nr:3-deoxy-D-manno-octulosonate 8-phosphate phosphatase [Phaeodactylibacter sp.]MCB9263735.1 3-deoxy-D-manno-octulosonate 8-phosphate phosphatase [Lewinellaceae bacterium]MCB9286857.1 3-deoxy-D-manno-octulosonate 8-phosphate phosphatase [Lewinellaceae bacterium]